MMILVATNIVASLSPECQPTGTPTARAKIFFHKWGTPYGYIQLTTWLKKVKALGKIWPPSEVQTCSF